MTHSGAGKLHFRAVDLWTAVNVGLNDVDLAITADGRVSYRIRYPRWAGYVLGLCGVLGAVLVVTFEMIDIRDYIARHPGAAVPGVSLEGNVAVAWGMAFFWGLVWPWILIAFHKRPLRRLMDRIIFEVDTAATSAG
jgi:hypothetical protein